LSSAISTATVVARVNSTHRVTLWPSNLTIRTE
jgi:hypothetical protein